MIKSPCLTLLKNTAAIVCVFFCLTFTSTQFAYANDASSANVTTTNEIDILSVVEDNLNSDTTSLRDGSTATEFRASDSDDVNLSSRNSFSNADNNVSDIDVVAYSGVQFSDNRLASGSNEKFSSDGAYKPNFNAVLSETNQNQDEEDLPYVEGSWKKNSVGWWWQYPDETYPTNTWLTINNQRFYFNSKGYACTGWQHIGGYWYYFNTNSCAMTKGWLSSSGSWYYLDDNSGKMLNSCWLSLRGVWYYLNPSGAMATGWKQISSKWYYFKSNGSMACNGWIKLGSDWYLLSSSGAMLTGWQQYDGKWYYLSSSGKMLKNTWVGDYYVGSDGSMATNTWIGSYYVDETGKWVSEQYYTIRLSNGSATKVYGYLDSGLSKQIVSEVNSYRSSNGYSTLAYDSTLARAAETRAIECAYSFSHTRPDGSDCFSAVNGSYGYLGENLARGYTSPSAVMAAWKNSPGHNANLLNTHFDSIGVGVFVEVIGDSVIYYWAQMFGN